MNKETKCRYRIMKLTHFIIMLKHVVTLFRKPRKTHKAKNDRLESNKVYHLQSVRRVKVLPAYWSRQQQHHLRVR
jgi:hypothetical protein